MSAYEQNVLDGNGEASHSVRTLYAVTHTKIEKLPYSEENEEYMPRPYQMVYTESFECDYDEVRDIIFENGSDLVVKFYAKQGISCPISIQPFDELLEQTITGVKGEQHFIDSHISYFECYGIDYLNIYWIRDVSVIAGIVFSEREAKEFIDKYMTVLERPQIISIKPNTLIDDIDIWTQKPSKNMVQ